MNKEIRLKIIDLTILFFNYRNTYNLGFQRYSVFRNMIRYINGNTLTDKQVRVVFQTLVSNKNFEKIKNLGTIYYRWNYHNKVEIILPYIEIVF